MSTATAKNLATAALACQHTHKSFRTLAKHAARGSFDPDRALALLRNNVRDAAQYVRNANATDIGQAAQLLLEHWQRQPTDSE